MWDVFVCIRDRAGFQFYVHALLGFVVSSSILYPTVQYYGCLFLLCELSTPFLHLRFFLIEGKKTETFVFQLSQYTFALIFFVVRILLGSYYSLCGWIELLPYLSAPAPYNIACHFYMIADLGFASLNFIWFYAIVSNIVKHHKKEEKGVKASRGTGDRH